MISPNDFLKSDNNPAAIAALSYRLLLSVSPSRHCDAVTGCDPAWTQPLRNSYPFVRKVVSMWLGATGNANTFNILSHRLLEEEEADCRRQLLHSMVIIQLREKSLTGIQLSREIRNILDNTARRAVSDMDSLAARSLSLACLECRKSMSAVMASKLFATTDDDIPAKSLYIEAIAEINFNVEVLTQVLDDCNPKVKCHAASRLYRVHPSQSLRELMIVEFQRASDSGDNEMMTSLGTFLRDAGIHDL